MQTYGPFYPSIISAAGWTNPNNAKQPGNGVASVVVLFDSASPSLTAAGFNANIPSDKTILEVRLELPSMEQGDKLFNNSDQVVVGPLGEQEAGVSLPFIRVESDSTPGLTPAVVNDASFGFKFSVYNGGQDGTFSIDSLPLYVDVE